MASSRFAERSNRRTGVDFQKAIVVAGWAIFVGFGAQSFRAPLRATETVPAGAILRARTDPGVEIRRLRPGAVVSGTFADAVYSGEREAIPAGAGIRLEIEAVERRAVDPAPPRRSVAARLEDLLRATRAPGATTYTATVRSARLILPGGAEAPVEVTLLEISRLSRISPGRSRQADPAATMILRVERPIPALPPAKVAPPAATASGMALAPGTRARLMLLTPVSASASREGDALHARLLEPVRLGDRTVLPEGCVFEGRIARTRPPRRLIRGGQLRLVFDRLILPDGAIREISTSLDAVESDHHSPLRIDTEGTVASGPQSKKAMLLNLGVSYAFGKIVDDLFEEGIKYGFTSLTPGAVASAARYVGIATGLAWFLTQRGRDVRLGKYTVLDTVFTRPVTIQTSPDKP